MDHLKELYATYLGRARAYLGAYSGTSPEEALQEIRPYLTAPIIGLALFGLGLLLVVALRLMPARRSHTEEILKGRPAAHTVGLFLMLLGLVLAVPH